MNAHANRTDGGPESGDMSFAKIKLALNQARRELLDPSRRNRLLHAPLSGKRPCCMAVVDNDPDGIFRSLCRQEKFRGYAFVPSDVDEPAEVSDQSLDISVPSRSSLRSVRGQTRHGRMASDTANGGRARSHLQTRLTSEKLERRLTKIFREERTLEEEQGVSTLYLALARLSHR